MDYGLESEAGLVPVVFVVFGRALFRNAPHFVELAVRAPGFGVEAGRAGHGLNISVRAVVGRAAFFRRFAPAAAVITLNGRRLHRRVNRGNCGRQRLRYLLGLSFSEADLV